ncbi:pentatricopeptide repeat-containing protein [Trifolium medium]|uniref:Pentatricopeptide repeat-containing protein n=1 Tax=Trifolium medium TaxID=97028 RepID=A0A392LZ40_9FABA|nr:pentatricopeptide repeat-containing protein [Trifolium medium]
MLCVVEKFMNMHDVDKKWLDCYGPFEAVIDAANINAVVNKICHKLPSKMFPLIVLHHRRIKGDKRDGPINKALVDRWNYSNALYVTPTGSYDDWYASVSLMPVLSFTCRLLVLSLSRSDKAGKLLAELNVSKELSFLEHPLQSRMRIGKLLERLKGI